MYGFSSFSKKSFTFHFRLENAPVAVFIQEKLQGADILTYLSTKEQYSEQTIATIVTQVYYRRFLI